jgi:hypothetical protein
VTQKGFSTVLLVLIIAVLTALVVGGGMYYWQKTSFEKMKQELREEVAQPETSTSAPEVTPSPTPTPPDKYEDWLTYENDVYRYQFRYPEGAETEEVTKDAFGLSPDEVSEGLTFEDKFNKYTGKICITLYYDLGYVQISAPPNKNMVHVICGRTGRAYEGEDKAEELEIDGKTYEAEGFEEKGPGETLNLHNETLVVTLEDGTRIEYGSQPDGAHTFSDYQKMREEIIKIVESYQAL